MITARFCLIAGALFGASGVLLGAWGAHGLEAFLQRAGLPPRSGVWDTAVLYQLVHAPVLLGVAALHHLRPQLSFRIASASICLGILAFSGSLYALVLGGPSALGPVTPLGGVALIVGWCALLVGGIGWPSATDEHS